MGFNSREEELKLKIADLLLTMLKDASIKGMELGLPPDVSLEMVADMVEQLNWALKHHKDLLGGRGGRPDFGGGGFPMRPDDDEPPGPPRPRRSPYNRS